jgi:hypothetical protein
LFYESERDHHIQAINKKVADLKDAQAKLMVDSGEVRVPRERRQELNDIKTKLHEFNQLKTQQIFFGKRDRIIKAGWRHGVFGVDDADSNQTSVFYKDSHDQKVKQ